MKLGAEPKKMAFLGILGVVAVYALYSNVFSTPSSGAHARVSLPPAPQAVPQSALTAPVPTSRSTAAASRRTTSEFRPSFKTKDVDPSTIDPKLRLDLLAKVQSVEVGPAQRNLFQFGAAPVPVAIKNTAKIIPLTPAQIAQQQAALNPGPPVPPPPPPITLKYYGYAAQRADGRKRAFFLEGDCSPNAVPTAGCDIFVAAEGELIKRRYKVVRIGVSSAEVEDIEFNHVQPLPLAEEAPPG